MMEMKRTPEQARELYDRIMRHERSHLTRIVKFAVRDEAVENEAEAWKLMPALVQWFVAYSSAADPRRCLMPGGRLDKLYHAFFLCDTEWYLEKFCPTYMGMTIHHKAAVEGDRIDPRVVRENAFHTINHVEFLFGEATDAFHRQWKEDEQAGKPCPIFWFCASAEQDTPIAA